MGIEASAIASIPGSHSPFSRVHGIDADEPEVKFDAILRRVSGSEDPARRARAAAEEFVAQALVLPILKEVRESNTAPPPFGPGPYEKNIGSLFDAEIASRMVKAQRFSIVDAVARNLLRVASPSEAEAPVPEQGGSHVDADAAQARTQVQSR